MFAKCHVQIIVPWQQFVLAHEHRRLPWRDRKGISIFRAGTAAHVQHCPCDGVHHHPRQQAGQRIAEFGARWRRRRQLELIDCRRVAIVLEIDQQDHLGALKQARGAEEMSVLPQIMVPGAAAPERRARLP